MSSRALSSRATWNAGVGAALLALLLLTTAGCASLPPDVQRVQSYAIADAESTTLRRVFSEQARQYPGLSGFQVMATGQSAFVARAALADAAERSLDLQYFSVGDDRTTDLLLQRIVAAAERGVRVRILLDDLYTPNRLFAWRAIASHPGIEVRLFNPYYFGASSNLARLVEFAVDGRRLNHRMHNKLWVTDNAAAIIGSRNLGDEYFDANESGNFQDVDLLAAGAIVRDLSYVFDVYWNSASVFPALALIEPPTADDGAAVREDLRARVAACAGAPPCRWVSESGLLDALRGGSVSLSWARAQLFYDAPDLDKAASPSHTEHESIEDSEIGARTRRELLLMSPYFVPSPAGIRHLGEMRERGVRVAVLTNSLASTDSPAAHAGYERQRATLLRDGVELYEIRPEPGAAHRRSHRWGQASAVSLHAKFLIQDRAHVVVGSLNQDSRSRFYNTEACVAVDSAELAADLAALFEEGTDLHEAFKLELSRAAGNDRVEWVTEEDGGVVRSDVEPLAGPGLLLWRSILGTLIPEDLL
jgi:cardiolipin synthase C